MLSYPDFIEKQLVVITSDDYKNLSLEIGNIVIKDAEGKIQQKMACAKIFVLFILGDCTITTKLVDELLSYGIVVYFLGTHMKPKFFIGNSLEGNYLLREKQYAYQNNIDIAKKLIMQKASNQLGLLQEIRDKDQTLKDNIKQIKGFLQKIEIVDNPDSLRGLEGNVAKLFFTQYFADQKWYKRQPRTKVDIINYLLDVGYSMLYSFVEANLQLYGFDVYKGVYHTLFFERKSLVCDLVEPFRFIIDRSTRKAYNLGQISEKDFTFKKGQYNISFAKRQHYVKIFLSAILEEKELIFTYIKNYYRYTMNDENEFPKFS